MGDEMRLYRLKGFSNSSKYLFSIVKLKSPINKILSYFFENAFIVLDRLLIKIIHLDLVVCYNPQIATWNSEHRFQERYFE